MHDLELADKCMIEFPKQKTKGHTCRLCGKVVYANGEGLFSSLTRAMDRHVREMTKVEREWHVTVLQLMGENDPTGDYHPF